MYATSGKRLTRSERSKMNFSNIKHETIIGLLLGDGHISKRSVKGNSRFVYAQSAIRSQHIAYFNHVYSIFKPYCSKDFIPKLKIWVDKRTQNKYQSSSFTTLSLPCLNLFKNLFYVEGHKIVPANIAELLTYRGLAYLIMDDGSIQNKGLHLNTYGFSDKDIELLLSALKNKFQLKCSIHKHKAGLRIYIWEESMVSLRKNIVDYTHKDMLYKIGISS